MSWTDKVHKKEQLRRQIDNAMRSPEYKKMQREHDLNVFLVYCLISADFLSIQEKYGAKRMKRFLDFVKERMNQIGEEEAYDFAGLNDSLTEKTGVNVMEYLGFEVRR